MTKELIVKYRKIKSIYLSGKVETNDTRYRIRLSKNKLIRWLIRNSFQFSVGINGTTLVDNLNYIEVWSNSFFEKDHLDKNELIRKFLEKHSIMKRK